MSFDLYDSAIDRLEGTDPTDVTSGLIIKKMKDPSTSEEIVFKKPRTSLFGLDKLASEKRKEAADVQTAKDRQSRESRREERSGSRDKSERREHRHRDRDEHGHLRKPRIETPSHTGGVSDDYEKRKRVKEENERKRGIKVSTSHERREHKSHRSERRNDPTPRSSWDDDEYDYEYDNRHKSSWEWTPRDDRYSRSGSSWDKETPRRDDRYGTPRATPITYETSSRRHRPRDVDRSQRSERRGGESSRRSGRREYNSDGEEEFVDEEEIKMRDRVWYDEDADHNPFGNMSEDFVVKKEESLKKSKAVQRISAQQRQINKDNEKWETNRMLLSGVVIKTNVNDDEDDQLTAGRVHLMVHNIVPPFLDGRIVFTKQPEPVVPVKDSTSDMAILSKKGSALVRYHREMKERKRAQKKEWELAGTKLGDIMGIAKPKDETETNDGADYKADQRFKDQIDDKKTDRDKILKQRQYLPVFACRSELLNIIRDNSIVIIVGETGSGKTTQLTQVIN